MTRKVNKKTKQRSAAHNRAIGEGVRRAFAKKKREAKRSKRT